MAPINPRIEPDPSWHGCMLPHGRGGGGALLGSALREVTLTMGGGTTKSVGESQNFGYLLWGDHKILGTFYGGDHKINF